ncbi:MAG TPA: Gfo/Idh/MocA family oxidoreductase [Opitutaceae bacterium]|nr:Gfo/Idh/MocA family oxidoreductase [Opitutaceae bacterium]
MRSPPVSRRRFLGQLSAASALAFLPRTGRAQAVPSRKLGVVLVGLGRYATNQLAPALRVTEHCRLAGVVTGDAAKGARWAQEHGFPEGNVWHYDRMDRIAGRPDVDIVYVVTPPGLHAPHSIAAARAGKHLICEKPMANTVAECDAILAACAKAGVKHAIGYRLFWDPYHTELRRLAREGDFGPFMRLGGDRAFRINEWRWRVDKKLAGGGPLMDVGVYLIQGACMAKDGRAPVAVTATELPKTRPDLFKDTEETIRWSMEWADGALAEFSTSYQQNADWFRCEAPRGWMHFKSRAFGYVVAGPDTSRGPLDFGPPVNQQARQMDGFARHLLGLEPNPVPGEMGRRDLAIIEAIYASAAAGGTRVEVRA